MIMVFDLLRGEHIFKKMSLNAIRVQTQCGADGGIRTRTPWGQGIFTLLHVAMAAFRRCSPDYVLAVPHRFRPPVYSLYTFTISRRYRFSSALSRWEIRRISRHSRGGFPAPVLLLHKQKSPVSAIPPHQQYNYYSMPQFYSQQHQDPISVKS